MLKEQSGQDLVSPLGWFSFWYLVICSKAVDGGAVSQASWSTLSFVVFLIVGHQPLKPSSAFLHEILSPHRRSPPHP